MLLAQLLDNLGPGRRRVAEHRAPDRLLERLDDLRREALRIQGEGSLQDDAAHLPMPRGRVLARRALGEPAVGGPRRGLRRHALDRGEQAEAQPLEVRGVDPTPVVVMDRLKSALAGG